MMCLQYRLPHVTHAAPCPRPPPTRALATLQPNQTPSWQFSLCRGSGPADTAFLSSALPRPLHSHAHRSHAVCTQGSRPRKEKELTPTISRPGNRNPHTPCTACHTLDCTWPPPEAPASSQLLSLLTAWTWEGSRRAWSGPGRPGQAGGCQPPPQRQPRGPPPR